MQFHWVLLFLTLFGCGAGRTSLLPFESEEESNPSDAGRRGMDTRLGFDTHANTSRSDGPSADRRFDAAMDLVRRDGLPSLPVDARRIQDSVADNRPNSNVRRVDARLDTGLIIPPPMLPPILPPPPPPPNPPVLIDGGTDAPLILSANACPPGANRSSCERQGLTCVIYTNGTVTGGCACLNLGRTARWFCLQ